VYVEFMREINTYEGAVSTVAVALLALVVCDGKSGLVRRDAERR
jgi:hypothetical protein